jgi:phospholipid/cholesterol/gamma-HCH transport system substrate-binding protein
MRRPSRRGLAASAARLTRDAPRRLPRRSRLVAGATALAVVAAGLVVLWPTEDRIRVVAHFSKAVGVYEGSDVRVLGVPVGTITGVEPAGKTVRVTMEVEEQYDVPADAKAAVVSPSVVSDRYVQLAPVYEGGPTMQDGAEIPRARTATPVELDETFASLNRLNKALGPEGANENGSLSRLLEVGADNLDGQGEQLNQTLTDLSRAVETLSEGRGDLFSTVRNLQVFTTALAESDDQVRAFNADLEDVSSQLAGERQELAAALRNLAVALAEVKEFVRTNKDALSSNLAGLSEVTDVLVRQKKTLAEIVDTAPVALGNLNLAYNPSSGTLDTRDNVRQLDDPALYLCSLIKATNAPDKACDRISGLFSQLQELEGQGRLPERLQGVVPSSSSGGTSGGASAPTGPQPSTPTGFGGLLEDE